MPDVAYAHPAFIVYGVTITIARRQAKSDGVPSSCTCKMMWNGVAVLSCGAVKLASSELLFPGASNVLNSVFGSDMAFSLS